MWVELVSGAALALALWVVLGRLLFQKHLWSPQAFGKGTHTLKGKKAIVTGANSGLGFATAEELVRRGCHVFLACRNPRKGKQAEATLNMRYSHVNGAGFAQFIKLDLSDERNIRDLVWKLKKQEKVDRIDYLINNAGIGGVKWDEQSVNLESLKNMMRVNWYHPWMLTESLLCSLKISRVVFVSSVYHSSLHTQSLNTLIEGHNDSDTITQGLWNDLLAKKHGSLTLMTAWLQTYALSKYLEIITVKYILQRKYEMRVWNGNHTANGNEPLTKFISVNPGYVRSGIWDYSNMPLLMKCLSLVIYPFVYCVWRDCHDGCQTIIDACVNPEMIEGEYYSNCQRDQIIHPLPDSVKPIVEALSAVEFKLN